MIIHNRPRIGGIISHRQSSRALRLRAAFLLVPLLYLSASSLLAQSLQITSPADGTVVSPGQSLKVTVEASPASAFAGVGLIGKTPIGVTSLVSVPPYEFAVPIPNVIRPGSYTLGAIGQPLPGQGKPGRGPNYPEPVYSAVITLIVERADEPLRLEIYPPILRLQPGSKGYLSVTGVFADGQKVDLRESTKTIYTSDTPSVVTVDPKSVVNALGPGAAKITVNNGKAKIEIPVVVSAPRGR
jgi:hypothetical protein